MSGFRVGILGCFFGWDSVEFGKILRSKESGLTVHCLIMTHGKLVLPLLFCNCALKTTKISYDPKKMVIVKKKLKVIQYEGQTNIQCRAEILIEYLISIRLHDLIVVTHCQETPTMD